MLITDAKKAEVARAIREVAEEFQAAPGTILTEDDLKCRLFGKLTNSDSFRGQFGTADKGILASMVHAEVSWFDDNGHLTIKPDLTILEPENLSLIHAMTDAMRLPAKGFHFIGQSIIFELKMVRDARAVNQNTLELIERDFQKIQGLFNKLSNSGDGGSVFCYFVVFSKGRITSEPFHALLERYRGGLANCSVIYEHVDLPAPPTQAGARG